MWWTAHLSGGPRRVNHAAVAIAEKIYSFGGYCTGDNYKDKKPIDVFILNTMTYRWTSLPKPDYNDPTYEDWPYQRYGHSISPHGDKIYLFGGRNDNSLCNTLYVFNTVTLTWTRPKVYGFIPNGRDGHTSTIINDCLYICGGYEDEMTAHLVCKLDLKTMMWSVVWTTGVPPLYRDFHSATEIGGDKLFIFGGRSEVQSQEIYPPKVHYLDTTTMTWCSPAIKGMGPTGRRSHSAVNFNDNLLIFGGYNGRQDKHYNDIWLLDTVNWTWRQVIPHGRNGPNPRRRQAMCRVGNRLFVFGGTSPYQGPPLYFTEEQLQYLPLNEVGYSTVAKLIDHNDTFVLDTFPTLKTLSLITVIENNIPTDGLPSSLLQEFEWMTQSNNISQPLATLPLG